MPHKILSLYCYSPWSLDEAFLDITEHVKGRMGRSSAQDVVQEMRQKIEAKTRLTASAGIAPNTMLAKICSDQNKPNGQFFLASGFDISSIVQFMTEMIVEFFQTRLPLWSS